MGAQIVERLLPAGGHVGLVPLLRQRVADGLAHVRVVIDHEDRAFTSAHRGPHLHWIGSAAAR